MEWWQLALAVAGGSSLGTILGAMLTYLVSSRDVQLRSRVETIKVFMDASARVAGRLEDGNPASIAERIAAVHLLADLGSRDKWLREAAASQLEVEAEAAALRATEAVARAEFAADEYDRAIHQDGMNPDDNPWELTPEAMEANRSRSVVHALDRARAHLQRGHGRGGRFRN